MNKRMTIKEFWDWEWSWTPEDPYTDLAIHCENKEQAEIFCKASAKLGKKWHNGGSYLEETEWGEWDEKNGGICYTQQQYASYKYLKRVAKRKGYKILEFNDIDFNCDDFLKFEVGELVICKNDEKFKIGIIKEVYGDDSYLVYYHTNEEAIKTPIDNLYKIDNATAFHIYRLDSNGKEIK